jgi:hypothetical protein
MIDIKPPILNGNNTDLNLISKGFFEEETGSAGVGSDCDNVD